MILIESIEDYLRFLQHEKGATKTTCKSYTAYLRNFHKWLINVGYATPALADFNNTTIRRFFYYVSEKGLRPRSIYGYMVPLRSYGAFLIEQNVLTQNPALTVKLPKKDAAIRQEASEEEIQLLLNSADRLRNQNRAVLLRGVLSVLVYTGLRRAEVCNLLLEHLNLKAGWLIVQQGKGQKSREVPLCAELKDALLQYLRVRPHRCASQIPVRHRPSSPPVF